MYRNRDAPSYVGRIYIGNSDRLYGNKA